MTDSNATVAPAVEAAAEVDAAIAQMKAITVPLRALLEDVLELTELGAVINCYDTHTDPKFGEKVAKDAKDYVLNGIIGAMSYNVIEGHKLNGARMFNKALDDVETARIEDTSWRSEKSAAKLERAIKWAATMDVQQIYRKVLQPTCTKLYAVFAKKRYPTKVASSARTNDSPEQAKAVNLRAMRAKLDEVNDAPEAADAAAEAVDAGLGA